MQFGNQEFWNSVDKITDVFKKTGRGFNAKRVIDALLNRKCIINKYGCQTPEFVKTMNRHIDLYIEKTVVCNKDQEIFDEKYPYNINDIGDLDHSNMDGYEKLIYKWVNELIMGGQTNPANFFKCGYANPDIVGFPNVSNWKNGKHPRKNEEYYKKIISLVGNIDHCIITGLTAVYLVYGLKHIPTVINMIYSNGNIEFKQYIVGSVIGLMGKNYKSHVFIGVRCVIYTALDVEIHIFRNIYGDIIKAISSEYGSAYKFGVKLEDGGNNMICLALPSAIISHLGGSPVIIDNWGLYDGTDPFAILVEYEKMGLSIKLNNKLISMINSQDIKEVYSGLEILFLIPDYYANINNELLKITIYNLIRRKDPLIINYFIDNFNKIHPQFHQLIMFNSALHGIEQLFIKYSYVSEQNLYNFEEIEDLLTYAVLGGNRGIIKFTQNYYRNTLFNLGDITNMYSYGALLFVICCKYDIELIEWFNKNLNIAKFLNDIKDVLNPGLNKFYNFESWMYTIDFNLYAKSLIYLHKKFVPNLPKILPSTLINLMYINGWNNENDLIKSHRTEIIKTSVIDKNLLGIVAEYYLPDEIYNDSTIKQH